MQSILFEIARKHHFVCKKYKIIREYNVYFKFLNSFQKVESLTANFIHFMSISIMTMSSVLSSHVISVKNVFTVKEQLQMQKRFAIG